MNRGGDSGNELSDSMDDAVNEHNYFGQMAHELITAVHGHDADSVREVLRNCANHLMDDQYSESDETD